MPVLACGRVESEVTRGAEIKYLEEHIWQFYTTAGKQRGGGGEKKTTLTHSKHFTLTKNKVGNAIVLSKKIIYIKK